MKGEPCLWKYWVQHVLDHLQSVQVQIFFIQNIFSYILKFKTQVEIFILNFKKRSGVLSTAPKISSGVLSQFANFSGVLFSGALSVYRWRHMVSYRPPCCVDLPICIDMHLWIFHIFLNLWMETASHLYTAHI